METVVSSRAVLTFEGDAGAHVRLSVPRARADVGAAEAAAAMGRIVAGGAVLTAAGRPVSAVSAEIVTTERVRLA